MTFSSFMHFKITDIFFKNLFSEVSHRTLIEYFCENLIEWDF
jgi:hypothetical protein